MKQAYLTKRLIHGRALRFPIILVTHILRHRVEKAVDEAGFLLAVEGLGDVDIFGDDAARGHVDPRGELVGAGAQYLAHRPVEAVERPVRREAGGDGAVKLRLAGGDSADQVVEEIDL